MKNIHNSRGSAESILLLVAAAALLAGVGFYTIHHRASTGVSSHVEQVPRSTQSVGAQTAKVIQTNPDAANAAAEARAADAETLDDAATTSNDIQ